jgi:glycosyltransferase involved in cell wall biosynthesis
MKKITNYDFEILFFGAKFIPEFNIRYHNFGYIWDARKMNLLSYAANFTIVPSLQENLSNVIMESLASGTPVIAFDVGGNSDMIINNFNGYLINEINSEKLSEKIISALQENNNEELSQNAKKFIQNNFSYQIIGEKYLNLYNKLLNNI